MCNKRIRFIAFVLLLSGILTIAVRGADPNLVGWWAFEEESGVLHDQSDYQNDGIPTGGVIYQQPGIQGFALGFNGTDSFVTIGKNARPQNSFTFGGWIKTSLQHEIDTQNSAGQVGIENKRYAFYPRFEYGMAGAGLSVGTNGISVIESSNGYLPAIAVYEGEIGSDWNHIMVVYNARTPTIFLNGQAVHTGLISARNPVWAPIEFGGYNYGFFDGQMDDIRIYNRALEQTEVEQLMLRYIELASAPTPGYGESDVYYKDVVLSWKPGVNASQHDVYFGMVFDDVNDATITVDPAGAYMGRQGETTYTLGRLDFGQIYYWRVDEITPGKIVKGDLWQFTVEPLAYALAAEHVIANASSSSSDGEGPERTIDASGLDGDDLHSTKESTMWLSSNTGTSGAWIQYEFDLTYLLHQMLVWNYNSTMEPFVGFGVKDVTIDTSINGSDWTALGESHEFAKAPGAEGYAANTVVDFGNMPVKAVRLNIAGNWGGLLQQYGLSEVRFTVIPLSARVPNPATGSTGLDTHTVLSWRAGRQAAEHDVYLSTDEQAVIDGTAPVTTVSEAGYDAGGLDLGVTYYWKVNEVNGIEDPALWEGDVWSFTVMEFLTVDDFEDYNNSSPNRVFQTWIDGIGYSADEFFPVDNPGNGTGAALGHDIWSPGSPHYQGDIMETSIVYSGIRSMPLAYNNSAAPFYSETEREWAIPQDWTANGIRELSLMVRGQQTNNPDMLYVGIQDAAGKKVILNHPDGVDAVLATSWTEWVINLQDVAAQGVNLARVKTLYLGVGDNTNPANAAGLVFIDTVRLYGQR